MSSGRADDDFDDFGELPDLPSLEEPTAAAREKDVTCEIPAGSMDHDEGRHTLSDAAVVGRKYRLAEKVSHTMSEIVYSAEHTGIARMVELHMLPIGVSREGPEARRLVHGARAAGRVPHRNIISVVDSDTDQHGRPFIVYEARVGLSAADFVDQHGGGLQPELVAEVMRQVLLALHTAHEGGVVHRNVTPEHVHIDTTDPTKPRAKLMGFGLATIDQSRGRAQALTSADGQVMPDLPSGYSRYLAPEVRRGEVVSSPAMDIYAAGVLMLYLLTGDTNMDVPIDEFALRAIARATAPDPEERFTTAEHFLLAVTLMLPDEQMPDRSSSEELPRDGLAADLYYLQQRRLRDSGVTLSPAGSAQLELRPVLLMVEAIYKGIRDRWPRLVEQVNEVEDLLPASGRGAHFAEHGVPVELVERMLAAADTLGGEGDLRWLAHIGEAMANRGLTRICPQLPTALAPEALVDCIPVLWRSISRHGEVVQLDSSANGARIAVRAQVEPSLEITAVVAGLLRAALRSSASDTAEVKTIACQALGDAADIFVLSW